MVFIWQLWLVFWISMLLKVIINMPTVTPAAPQPNGGAFEDTMFLIDLMRQQREKEIRAKKVSHTLR